MFSAGKRSAFRNAFRQEGPGQGPGGLVIDPVRNLLRGDAPAGDCEIAHGVHQVQGGLGEDGGACALPDASGHGHDGIHQHLQKQLPVLRNAGGQPGPSEIQDAAGAGDRLFP